MRDSAPDALLIAGRFPTRGLEGFRRAPAEFPVGITQRAHQGRNGRLVLAPAERLNDRLPNVKVRICNHWGKELGSLLPLPRGNLLDSLEPD